MGIKKKKTQRNMKYYHTVATLMIATVSGVQLQALSLNADNEHYEETNIAELHDMMESIPLQGDDWTQLPEVLDFELSLEQFWNSFWAVDAPHNIALWAASLEPSLEVTEIRYGETPQPGLKLNLGMPVLEEKTLKLE